MTDTIQRRSRPYAARMAPEERREQLLDAVLRVIVKDGVHRVSIDSVAKESGVTRPVVYGHFADSDDLLRASLKREEAAALQQLADVLPNTDQETLANTVIASLEGFLFAVRERPDRWRAIFTLADSSTPTFRARVEAGRTVVLASFEKAIHEAMSEGDLDRDTDAGMLARLLYAVFWDAGRLVLSEPDDYPQERIIRFARHAVGRFLVGPSR